MTKQQAHLTALVLRLSLGIMFISHGLLKLMVFTPAGTAGFFESLGLPSFLGHATMGAEILGGALLIAGFQARAVILTLLPVLIGSIVFVHGANGWQFGAEGGGWEYSAFLIAISLAQAIIGGGAYVIKIPGLNQDIFEPLLSRNASLKL